MNALSLAQQLAAVDISDPSKLGLEPVKDGEVILGSFFENERLVRLWHLRSRLREELLPLVEDIKQRIRQHNEKDPESGTCDCEAFSAEIRPLIDEAKGKNKACQRIDKVFLGEAEFDYCDPEVEYAGIAVRDGYSLVSLPPSFSPLSGILGLFTISSIFGEGGTES